jgi:hypothetical protein
MPWILTPNEWATARDKIAYAVCEVSKCGGTRKIPCARHRADAEKFMVECERLWDKKKEK